MHSIFHPSSVVIVGVSERPDNLARNIVDNLDGFSFKGKVHLVGNSGGRLNGRPIHRSLEEVPGQPELAVILVPAAKVPSLVDDCGIKGIRRVVVESGGFSEFSEEGRRLEQDLLKTARRHGIHLVGPNCISILNLENGLILPFVGFDPSLCQRGPISIIAQSGGVAFGAARLFSCENLGFDKLISMGNKLDLNENDYLEYLIECPGTKIIGLYLESLSDGRRLMNLAASTDKPIIALKSNTSQATHEIARFHTAALAGDDIVCEAALSQAGINRVHSLEEMTEHFKVFILPPMAGPNLAVIGRSGGQIVISADAAAANGFNLPPLPAGMKDLVRSRARAGVIRQTNPLDLGDVFDLEFYCQIVEAALRDYQVHGVLFQHAYARGPELESTKKLITAVGELVQRYRKPVLFCVISFRDDRSEVMGTPDFPLFSDPNNALAALAASRRHYAQARSYTPLVVPEHDTGVDERPLLLAGPKETFSLLRSTGIDVVESRLAVEIDEALQAAETIGYPVALKIAAAQVVHKTEEGGVKVDITNPRALRLAYEEMRRSFVSRLPVEEIKFLVQGMALPGVEVILGSKRDAEFGPVMLLGLGGVFAELLQDVVLRVAPVTLEQAMEMIGQLKAHALLQGYRGRPLADQAALAQAIANFSRVLLDNPQVEELEINPLIILPQGEGCLALDGRMRLRGKVESQGGWGRAA